MSERELIRRLDVQIAQKRLERTEWAKCHPEDRLVPFRTAHELEELELERKRAEGRDEFRLRMAARLKTIENRRQLKLYMDEMRERLPVPRPVLMRPGSAAAAGAMPQLPSSSTRRGVTVPDYSRTLTKSGCTNGG